MLAVAVFVATFVVMGFAVAGAGFAGRRSGSSAPPSRSADRLVYVGIAIVCVGAGAALPLALMAANADNAKADAVGGIVLTSAQINGRQLFAANCSNCHTLKATNSVAQTGPNLDVLRPPENLVLNAIETGRARGIGNMPAGLLTGKDAKDVANFVAAVAGHGEGVTTQAP